jgi:hypothetical protein
MAPKRQVGGSNPFTNAKKEGAVKKRKFRGSLFFYVFLEQMGENLRVFGTISP